MNEGGRDVEVLKRKKWELRDKLHKNYLEIETKLSNKGNRMQNCQTREGRRQRRC